MKWVIIQVDRIAEIVEKGIEQFVSTKIKAFFKRFELEDQFLQTEPSTWVENDSFTRALAIVSKLREVNDTKEKQHIKQKS